MNRFKDKTILITGASSGIGRAVAIAVSREGGKVILLARNAEQLEKTLSLMDNENMHLVIPFDLNQFDQYPQLFKHIKEGGYILDGLVHCAGIAPVLPLRTIKREQIQKVFDIHYFAFIELVKFYAKKGTSNGGSIVGISSINAHVPQKCMTAYSSAKSAVEAACRNLSLELTDKGTRINSVVVGGVNTNMAANTGQFLAGLPKEGAATQVARVQLLDIATPEQIAGPVLFLLSEDSSYITGRELYVDGGMF